MLKLLIVTGFALATLSGQVHAKADTAPAARTTVMETENWFMQAVGPYIAEQTLPSVFGEPQADDAVKVADDWENRL